MDKPHMEFHSNSLSLSPWDWTYVNTLEGLLEKKKKINMKVRLYNVGNCMLHLTGFTESLRIDLSKNIKP